jgi:hypothetical protein
MKKQVAPLRVGGTLDIGAGDLPYADASVAVDDVIPARPRNKPKRPITVVVSNPGAQQMRGLPLKLSPSSKLRLYWVGDAKNLPDDWNGKFSNVKSRNAQGALESSRFREPYAVLKKGGQIYVLANTGAPGIPDNVDSIEEIRRYQQSPAYKNKQEHISRDHITRIVSQLKAAGFEQIIVKEFRPGEMSFRARKMHDNGNTGRISKSSGVFPLSKHGGRL